MRLLKYEQDGELSITSFDDSAPLPPYAILSHTWGADAEEVTFAELGKGDGEAKHGYKKIRFCGQQVQQDNLQYFWVDTCCIDKTDKAELSHALQSMFRWYQNATKCYVYLSDVSTRKRKFGYEPTDPTWEPAFRSSRWFKRGWTLQELLAPSTVEFFSQEGERLGDKVSLKLLINKITGIPQKVLDGAPLFQFSVNERLRWKEYRVTGREEDGAYSLQGIFGVELVPVYGEGAASAFRRLMDEIHKQERCISDIHSTNPRDDKRRIEETKGGLLADSYRWVLDNATFQEWQQDEQSQLLWIKGGPGKGKTMLLCGIIDELQNSVSRTIPLLSYFFCQATDSRINSATAVLRGLLYMLVDQKPSLVSHVRKKHDHAGRTLFEDANAWVALTEIFVDVLRDPSLGNTCLVIDALDECVTDRPKLLEFIARQSRSQRVKWIVSSRNWPVIEAELEKAGQKIKLSLELNAKSVAAAVEIFIQKKVAQLAQEKQYKAEIRHAVVQHLTSNANGTFLWVALVCQDLRKTPNRHVLKKLASFPPGLDHLYGRMIDQIRESEDAETCQQVLALAAIVYRPVTIPELIALAKQLEDLADDLESVREIIGLCGSFLTVEEDTVYFVHQSAKDFLFTKAVNKVFPVGTGKVHQEIFSRSLAILSRTLQRDMYSLHAPGFYIGDVQRPDPDPLAVSRYPCTFWIDHLHDSNNACDLQVIGVIYKFLKEKYLYWLEGLSLCESVGKGIVSVTKLWSLMQEVANQGSLTQLVQDARRFIMYHKGAIESYPLQTYASALLFSPTGSLVKQLFQHEEPKGITIKPAISNNWSTCLQTLEGHSGGVNSVAFSQNSSQLASASGDTTINIWDTSSGACLQTLEGHSGGVNSVAFSQNSSQLASASSDTTVKIWDTSSGVCLQTLEGHRYNVNSVAFSQNSSQLASASSDTTIKIWDASSGACLQTLQGHTNSVNSVAFSHDGAQLVSASGDHTIRIWDASSGACLQTIESRSGWIQSVALSYDGAQLASGSQDTTVKIWDASSGACLQTLEGHGDRVQSVAFSHNGAHLASASSDTTIKIWDANSSACLQTPVGHSDIISSVAFSHDGAQLASASYDHTIRIWDASSGACLQTLEGHGDRVQSVAFSHNRAQLASGSWDKTVKIWDVSGACLQTLVGHSDIISSVAFSHDGAQLASASLDNTIKIWDASSDACLQTIEVGEILNHLSFSSSGSALYTEIGTIVIQSPNVSSLRDAIESEPPLPISVGLSSDEIWITYKGNKVLWLPSEYRPWDSSVCGNKIGIGAGSGRVWTCHLDW